MGYTTAETQLVSCEARVSRPEHAGMAGMAAEARNANLTAQVMGTAYAATAERQSERWWFIIT